MSGTSAVANKQLTLLLLHSGHRVLLGYKKRGFGEGKWNGFGGKVEPFETLLQCAVRETEEEAGVTVLDASYRGHITFQFENNPQLLEVHVFRATQFTGELRESDEMRPVWFPADEIPFEGMWADDRHWLPLLLAGKSFEAYFLFRGEAEIVAQTLTCREAFGAEAGDLSPVSVRQEPIKLI